MYFVDRFHQRRPKALDLKPGHYPMRLLPVTNQLTSLEVLNCPFVFFCRCSRIKGTKVSSLAGLRIFFARVEPILSRFQFSNHLKRDPCSSAFKAFSACGGGKPMLWLCSFALLFSLCFNCIWLLPAADWCFRAGRVSSGAFKVVDCITRIEHVT